MLKMEEYAWVLDFLPQGKPIDRYKEPLAQVLGGNYFTLLEVIVKQDIRLNIEQKIFVGKGDREEILRIKKRVKYDDLTATAQSQIPSILEHIVRDREDFFVKFFNTCGPVNIRQHQLELLPGIGKRHTKEIIAERNEGPFKSYEDIKKRIPLLPDPIMLIAHRVEQEIKGTAKHYMFAKPPAHGSSYRHHKKRW